MRMETPLAGQLERYLDLVSTQLKTTAGNMANVDTPGYWTRGFDFDAEMRRALSGASGNFGRSKSPRNSVEPKLDEVDGLLERPDGNNVSMDREGLNLAEAQLKFRTGIELIRREYTRLMDAIHAEAK